MLAALGALLLCAAPVKVAVPGFTVVGMNVALADAWGDRFVTLLGRDGGLKVISSKDIAQVLGFERQKQLLGCSDDQSSCLAELAGALGVDAILSGTFAQSGTSISATLRVLKASDGSQLAAATDRLKDVDALQDWLDAQAAELANKLRVAFNLVPVVVAAPAAAVGVSTRPSGGSTAVRWVPAVVGGAALVTGVVLFVLSKGYAEQLRNEVPKSRATIEGLASSGRTFETAGLGLMIGGGVAIAASLAWVILAPGAEVGAGFIPGSDGGSLVVGGSF